MRVRAKVLGICFRNRRVYFRVEIMGEKFRIPANVFTEYGILPLKGTEIEADAEELYLSKEELLRKIFKGKMRTI